jgi:hypothetical protein
MKAHGSTARQELFAQHYALCGNGTQAAIRASLQSSQCSYTSLEVACKGPHPPERRGNSKQSLPLIAPQIADEILTAVEQGVQSSFNLRRTQRGLALATRIKLYGL